MQEKRYYWLKLYDSFFENKTSKFLRRLPDGDKILIVYLKLQLKLLKSEGVFCYENLCDSLAEEIALMLDEDVNIIKLLLTALEKANTIEYLNENTFMLTEMQDLIGSEGNSWQEIFGDCDTKLSLSCTDIMSAEYVSKLLGVSTAESMSIRKNAGFEGELEYGQQNITNTQRSLLTPDEVIRLPFNIMLVILRGNKPYMIEKMIYTEHSLAKDLQDTPINEYIPEWKKVKNEVENINKIKKNSKPSFKNF